MIFFSYMLSLISYIRTFEHNWNNQFTWHSPFFNLKQWHVSLFCTNKNEILMTLKMYSLHLTIMVSLAFFLFLKIIFTLQYQCSIYYYFVHYYTLIYWISSNLTIPLTTINKSVLVNATDFTIEINTINHFLNNRAQTLNN